MYAISVWSWIEQKDDYSERCEERLTHNLFLQLQWQHRIFSCARRKTKGNKISGIYRPFCSLCKYLGLPRIVILGVKCVQSNSTSYSHSPENIILCKIQRICLSVDLQRSQHWCTKQIEKIVWKWNRIFWHKKHKTYNFLSESGHSPIELIMGIIRLVTWRLSCHFWLLFYGFFSEMVITVG